MHQPTTVECFFHTSHQAIIDDHSLTPSERSLDFVSTGDTGGFSDSHRGSWKTADAMIVPVPAEGTDEEDEEDEWLNDGFPMVAIEVGFSQTHESLMLDMRKWLDGSNGKTRAVHHRGVYSSKQFIQTQGTNAETSPAPETFAALVNPSLHPYMAQLCATGMSRLVR